MSTNGVTVGLSGNLWKKPPWGVIQGGWDQVSSFYEALSQSGGELVPSVKVVLVGAVRAGKTTLTRGLLEGEIAEERLPRTRGVDVHIQPWVPDFTPRLEVAIWDFAGHDDYYSTHQVSRLDLWLIYIPGEVATHLSVAIPCALLRHMINTSCNTRTQLISSGSLLFFALSVSLQSLSLSLALTTCPTLLLALPNFDTRPPKDG